jgi:hypothetical protein
MNGWPRVVDPPEPEAVVQVLMSEDMARRFEEHCLGEHTRARTCLSPPLLFSEDDLPTYTIVTAREDET